MSYMTKGLNVSSSSLNFTIEKPPVYLSNSITVSCETTLNRFNNPPEPITLSLDDLIVFVQNILTDLHTFRVQQNTIKDLS